MDSAFNGNMASVLFLYLILCKSSRTTAGFYLECDSGVPAIAMEKYTSIIVRRPIGA